MTSSSDGYKSVCYFVNWAIYGRNHFPKQLPAKRLTHVLYAFANVNKDSGEVYLSDEWSDVEKHFDGDSWNDPGGPNLYGCLKQLNLLKTRHRHLKVLLSIGGWTYSPNFAEPAASVEGRSCFARSAVRLLADHGFDGIDIDWEYPKNDEEATNFVLLLQEARRALDEYGRSCSTERRLLLTVASPAGPKNFKRMKLSQMSPLLDFFNLMAYDYAGPWDPTAAHQANWFPHPHNTSSTPFSTAAAIQYYQSQGIARSKIVIGMPLYGRAFANTDGFGRHYSGTGPGSWEQGVWDYKSLPRPNGTECNDLEYLASWSDYLDRTIITYDSPLVAKAKAQRIVTERLGGAMWWESSGDADGERSLIRSVTDVLLSSSDGLEDSPNNLHYPDSKYENLRNGRW